MSTVGEYFKRRYWCPVWNVSNVLKASSSCSQVVEMHRGYEGLRDNIKLPDVETMSAYSKLQVFFFLSLSLLPYVVSDWAWECSKDTNLGIRHSFYFSIFQLII